MSASDTSVPPPPVKNRRGLLIAFGIVQILIACLLFLMTLLAALLPMAAVNQRPASAISPTALAVVIFLVYGIPAVIFLVLGIGSIRAKNWARIGTLIISWIWLAFGVMQMFVVFFLLPSVLRSLPPQPNQPPNLEQAVVAGAAVFFGAFFVVLPAIFLAVYHSKHVRATCLAGTPEPRGVETPVILWILTLWMALGVLGMIYLLFTPYPAVIFGVLIPGVAGKSIYLTTGVVYVWAAWGLWRRELLAWRVVFWLQLFWVASAIVSFTTRDILQLYREMGMSAQELAFLERLPLSPNVFLLLCLVPTLVFMGLLFYAKRYFSTPPKTPIGP
jgi:hypothetical protein